MTVLDTLLMAGSVTLISFFTLLPLLMKETYNWTQTSSQRLMSDVTQKRSKESVLLVSAQLRISMHK